MDDLTIIKACAEAMGYELADYQPPMPGVPVWLRRDVRRETGIRDYNPLTDDAQAMALVKTLRIDCTWYAYQNVWCATAWADDLTVEKEVFDPDLNRAICLAVAMRGKE